MPRSLDHRRLDSGGMVYIALLRGLIASGLCFLQAVAQAVAEAMAKVTGTVSGGCEYLATSSTLQGLACHMRLAGHAVTGGVAAAEMCSTQSNSAPDVAWLHCPDVPAAQTGHYPSSSQQ